MARASDFADYVYANTTKRHEIRNIDISQRRRRLQLGKITHRDIELFLCHKWTLKKLGKNAAQDWSSYFVDESTEKPSKIFSASRLRIGSSSLRCVPDIVLFNRQENKFLIVERKTTFVPEPRIPVNAWPNVEAQLWCYSWIDEFQDANDVISIGEFWHRHSGGIQLIHKHWAWLRSDPVHNARCAEMFKAYGGDISG